MKLVGRSMQLVEFLAIAAIGYGTHLVNASSFPEWTYPAPTGIILLGSVIAIVLFQWLGAYEGRSLSSNRIQFNQIFLAWSITIGILLFSAYAFKETDSVSRTWAASWVFCVPLFLTLSRLVLRKWVHALARHGRFARRTVILGAGEIGKRIATKIRDADDATTEIVGFLDDRKSRAPRELCGYRILGTMETLPDLIQTHRIEQVIIALPWAADQRILDLVRQLVMTSVQIRLGPDLYGFAIQEGSFSDLRGLQMLHVMEPPITGGNYVVKLIEDKILASIGLVFLLPLFLVLSVIIKLDSVGPVFFRQTRYGFNNVPFQVWKFRTMYVNNPHQDGSVPATKDDQRITRVGRFLRKSSLDELPQILNVIKGDMSLVGPRPHPMGLQAKGRKFEELVHRYARRHNVKPGITGWAQVSGWRGEMDTLEKIQKRVEHDLYYIDHWSIWFDFKILALTALVVWNDKNAY